ncbi:TonB-dependent receptor [Flavicella sp.]|uniref:SusC/RagA family TonB-linked outer membrane protein n=1 Tax=Flavicella sp. TaxID=2957742 RepID=UPI003017CCAF
MIYTLSLDICFCHVPCNGLNFTINLSNPNTTLTFSYIGFKSKEIPTKGKNHINVILGEDISELDEVVVVGYGIQKKVTLTGAVTQVGSEVFENRATSDAVQSLQGSVPGLVVSNSSTGGEPGTSPNMNIRGLLASNSIDGGAGSFVDAQPYVLVDGIEMSLSNIDPEDIESVSVLKDAAAASIYGSRASGGVILVTTKSGKNMNGAAKISYSNNFSFGQPTVWPKSASAINFAYAVNDSRTNNFQTAYHDDTDLGNILANMKSPGSAPTISANVAGTDWDYGTLGIAGTAATEWDDIIFNDMSERRKHNLNITGGDEKLNYYISAGAYHEGGLLAVGDESFQRYNLDAKFSTQVNKWLNIELLTKVMKSYSDFPTEVSSNSVAWNKSRVLDLLSKLKPTLPLVDPIYGSELLQHKYYTAWDSQRAKTENNQLILIPRIIIEPIKDLKFTAQLNYKRNNNLQEVIILSSQVIRPSGLIDQVSQENTSYSATLVTNETFSPNIFTTYDKSVGNHNFHGIIGYQSEVYDFHSLSGYTNYLITDSVVSFDTSLSDDQLLSDAISNWSTQSVFSRFRYNYKEKYLFEFSYRRDGSSRFEPDNRWAGFPSYSVGYNIAKEDFWPFDDISTFKVRGSYGTLGNQNVPNFLYLTNIALNTTGTAYLFDGEREIYSYTPNLGSENLTWETVKTTDIGFDVNALNNRLGFGFSWYRTDIDGMVAQGVDLPTQLGATAPQTNIGTSRVQGWELEATWKQQLGDFGYNIRAVLSDYKRTIVDYPNESKSLNMYRKGQDLGEIMGLTWDGWFMTDAEAANHSIDQSWVTGWDYSAGDTKYKDLNGDNVIDRGDWVEGDTGDFSVIGNSTPRYQYAINLGVNYKNFDFNAFIQGVGKKDVLLSNHIRFRGPASGEFHFNVWEEHLDYFRAEDTASPLGANTDAYFPKPYMNGTGRNNKNYRYNVDRYIQNGAYVRLKSIQIGYTIPRSVTRKYKINKIRIFLTGENLFTISDLMFFDPEIVTSSVAGSAQSYPLSKLISTGINLSF